MSTNKAIALLEEMAVFAKVVEVGSFSGAARQLGSTPSAVSRSITRLEKALDTRLLLRTTRKLRLSEGGLKIWPLCSEMVESAKTVLLTSGHFNEEPSGVIKVSVPKAVGRFLVHPHIPKFLTKYPKVDIQLRLEDRNLDFIDEGIDIAIRITDQPPLGLKARPLLRIEHLLCATPQYLEEFGKPEHPHDLKKHSCIGLAEEPNDTRWKFLKDGKMVAVQVQGRYAANHTGVRLDATLQGIGIGSLPFFTARYALENGLLLPVLPTWIFKTNYSGQAWILYPVNRYMPPKLRVFIDFISAALVSEPTLSEALKPYEETELGVSNHA